MNAKAACEKLQGDKSKIFAGLPAIMSMADKTLQDKIAAVLGLSDIPEADQQQLKTELMGLADACSKEANPDDASGCDVDCSFKDDREAQDALESALGSQARAQYMKMLDGMCAEETTESPNASVRCTLGAFAGVLARAQENKFSIKVQVLLDAILDYNSGSAGPFLANCSKLPPNMTEEEFISTAQACISELPASQETLAKCTASVHQASYTSVAANCIANGVKANNSDKTTKTPTTASDVQHLGGLASTSTMLRGALPWIGAGMCTLCLIGLVFCCLFILIAFAVAMR